MKTDNGLAIEVSLPCQQGEPDRVCDMEGSISAVSFVAAKSLRIYYARRKEATSMPDSLEQLQQQRTDIIRQIGHLGDLRPGSSCTSNILYIEHPVHRNG